MSKSYKRENFDVTPEQEAEIDCLQELIKAPTRKDAMLTAVHLALHLAGETKRGLKLFLGDEQGRDLRRVVMIGVEAPNYWPWKYLVEIPHPWKKQLYVKGRKLPAAAVWTAMMVNKLSRDEAADNWELPCAAIDEIVDYCNANKELLQLEAAEEGLRLVRKGIKIEPKVARR
jgi:hypothetical protein